VYFSGRVLAKIYPGESRLSYQPLPEGSRRAIYFDGSRGLQAARTRCVPFTI